MITKFELFTEGILSKLKGPSYDEVLKNTTPDKLLKICFNNSDDSGVEYALEHGASVALYGKLTEMKEWFLSLITDLEKDKINKYLIYWKKNGEVLFQQDLKKNYLDVSFVRIWLVFEDEYHYDYNDIQIFIKNILEKQLNWKDISDIYYFISSN